MSDPDAVLLGVTGGVALAQPEYCSPGKFIKCSIPVEQDKVPDGNRCGRTGGSGFTIRTTSDVACQSSGMQLI